MNHNSSDVIFCYIWECGCNWHSNDFKPTTSNYLAVVRVTDQRVSRLLVAYRSRLNYKNEDWLIAISTDQVGDGSHGRSSIPYLNDVPPPF